MYMYMYIEILTIYEISNIHIVLEIIYPAFCIMKGMWILISWLIVKRSASQSVKETKERIRQFWGVG